MIHQKNIRILLLRVLSIGVVFLLLFFVWKYLEDYKQEIKIVGGTFHEGTVGTPRFINPVLAQSNVDHDLTRLLFSPLLEIKNNEVHYKALENIEISSDSKTYTLVLKKGQRFHDGRGITSQDLAFTIEKIQDPLIKSPLFSVWQGVKVEIVDNYTVKLELSRPFSDFIYNLNIGILPQHIWGNINPQEFIFSTYNIRPIGNGPYKIDSINYDSNGIPTRHTLVRSEQSNEKGYLKKVIVSFFENEEALIKALNKKQIDAVYGISTHRIDSLPKTHVIYSAPLSRVFGIFFNQEKQPLLRSSAVREAINIGINRETISEEIFGGYAYPIDTPIYTQIDRKNPFDISRAKELLDKDGWVLGEDGILEKKSGQTTTRLSFDLSIPNIEELKEVAESIKNQLGDLGIEVIIRSYDQGNFNQNIIRAREYETILFGYEVQRPSDLYAFWHSSQVSDPGLNISLFKNPRLDVLLDRLRNEEVDLKQEIITMIQEQNPAVFLYSPAYIYVVPEKVRDINLSITNSFDRFNSISEWFIKTRNVWPFFIS